jgi:hypothetical protein
MSDFGVHQQKDPKDYTGLKIAAVLAPVLLLFIYMGKEDTGLAVFIVLGVMIFAIKIRWRLRMHFWFWMVIVFILALHVPLFFFIRWPQGNLPTLVYTLPFGIADFLMISGALKLAERIFLGRR